MISRNLLITILIYTAVVSAHEDDYVKMYEFRNNNPGAEVGNLYIENTPWGMLITPEFTVRIQPGMHAMRVHAGLSCTNLGEILDLYGTAKNYGPYSENTAEGTLPNLYVDYTGLAKVPVLVPRMDVDMVLGHTFVIYDETDFYLGPMDRTIRAEAGEDNNLPNPKHVLYCGTYG